MSPQRGVTKFPLADHCRTTIGPMGGSPRPWVHGMCAASAAAWWRMKTRSRFPHPFPRAHQPITWTRYWAKPCPAFYCNLWSQHCQAKASHTYWVWNKVYGQFCFCSYSLVTKFGVLPGRFLQRCFHFDDIFDMTTTSSSCCLLKKKFFTNFEWHSFIIYIFFLTVLLIVFMTWGKNPLGIWQY